MVGGYKVWPVETQDFASLQTEDNNMNNDLYKNKYHTKSNRLEGYDYTQDYLVARGYAQSDTLAAEVDPELVTANTGFALDLFDELCADSPDSNVFISPLSISTALTMVYSGSDGTTEEAMRTTLGYGTLTREEIETGYEDLLTSLAGVD